jgi:hypothetical protein
MRSERLGGLVSIPASHVGGRGLQSRSGDPLSSLIFFMVSLNDSSPKRMVTGFRAQSLPSTVFPLFIIVEILDGS